MYIHNIEIPDKTANTFMNTLTACIGRVSGNGYTEALTITDDGLYSPERGITYAPGQVVVVNSYQFEGQSADAGDMIMYVIETIDGGKGLLVEKCGTASGDVVRRFMQQVEDYRAGRQSQHRA